MTTSMYCTYLAKKFIYFNLCTRADIIKRTFFCAAFKSLNQFSSFFLCCFTSKSNFTILWLGIDILSNYKDGGSKCVSHKYIIFCFCCILDGVFVKFT